MAESRSRARFHGQVNDMARIYVSVLHEFHVIAFLRDVQSLPICTYLI